MRLLIDTSAYSGFKRGVGAIVEAVRDADRMLVSGIVLGELRAGFATGDRQVRNEEELRAFLASSRVETVGIDAETSVYYAAIYAPLPDHPADRRAWPGVMLRRDVRERGGLRSPLDSLASKRCIRPHA